jgi:hypothetical protein
MRISRGISEFLQRLLSPVTRHPCIQIPIHKTTSSRAPNVSKAATRIVAIPLRVVKISRLPTHKAIDQCDSPEELLLHQYELLFSQSIFAIASCPSLLDQSVIDEGLLPHVVALLRHPLFPAPAKAVSASALVQFAKRPLLRTFLFQIDEFRQLFTLLRTPGNADFICQIVALFRLLTEDPHFATFFAVDEVATALVQAMRVAPTYQAVVLNVFSYLLIFGQNREVVLAVFTEFGEEIMVVLALQTLSMSRSSSDVVLTICGWLAGLVEKHERLGAVAATIVDPLDISVCAECLSLKRDRVVIRSVLSLIAALAGNATCAAILAGRKEVWSLFGKADVLADGDVCAALLNVVERFTFHNPDFVPENLGRRLPIIMESSNLVIQRSVLRIVWQITTPEHAFLLSDGIAAAVVNFLEHTDTVVCWEALQTIRKFLVVFHLEGTFFAEFHGKEKINEILSRENIARILVIAISELVEVCQEFGAEERASIAVAIRGSAS